MSIGVSASLVIFLIVQYDFSFDHFEKDGDRIFRVVSENSFQGNVGHTRGVQAPLPEAVRKEVSGIDLTVGFRYCQPFKITVQDPKSASPSVFRRQKNVIFADQNYFRMLSYHWLAGSAAEALVEPYHVVLGITRAKVYFPSLSPSEMIGKTIRYDYNDTLTAQVSGIVEDLDKQGNTDFAFQEFISLSTILDNPGFRKKLYWDDWGSTTSDQQLYVVLSKGSTVARVESQLEKVNQKYLGEDLKKNHYTWKYLLQPLKDIHFNSKYGILDGSLADNNTISGLVMIGAFLLLLGSINFINLTTAQASQRAKEIGVRKTMGSSRWQLVLQFLSETFVVTLAATILSLGLTPLLLKAFGKFIPEGLHFSLSQPSLFLFLAGLVGVVTLLAGFYPALVLSSWNALVVLKNQAYANSTRTRKAWVRETLTVTQFIIAQFFIMGTLLVSKQIRYMMNRDLGFQKEAVLSFGTPGADTSRAHRFYLLNEIRKIPGLRLASLASNVPSSHNWWTTSMEYKEDGKDIETAVELKSGDSNYMRIFRIPLLAGRELVPADTTREILINETYLHILGFQHPEDALNKNLSWDGKNVPIVGVMKDFHAHPLNFNIGPMAFFQSAENWRDVIVALQTGTVGEAGPLVKSNWQSTIARIKDAYKKVYPDEEFSYSFLDEDIGNAYNGQRDISSLLRWASGLTIFISCLGLLGLVIFITNHRNKEIGVRKVLGASVTQIVTILSKDFIKLVIIAFVIATPIAWWAMNQWLQGFAFRTEVSWWVFLVSGLGMVAIALITLSVQTVRAAMTNPALCLRTE
jgi:ABC-type antimicrobial peptide transport system permease subunit